MDAVALLRQQYAQAHGWLEATTGQIDSEQTHWCSPTGVCPAGAHYAHTLMGEDLILNMIVRGGQPLMMGAWAGKVGVSDMPPDDDADWSGWARSVKVDMDQLREYGQAVYAETDAYLASLTPADLEREFDSSPLPFGITTVAVVLNTLCGHVYMHSGEISMVKGMQGQRGYPV
jgi:hypothetical protein